MGEDLSTGAKIGITLIILCTLIAVVFSILTMMKNITNTGAAQLQGSLDQMMSSSFDDYNQKTVTGTQVLAALKLFEGQDVGIIIRTTLCGAKGVNGGYNYGAILKGYGGTGEKPEGTPMQDYGTIFAGKTEVDVAKVDQSYTTTDDADKGNKAVELAKSGAYYIGSYHKSGTSIQFNLNTKPTTASGNATYVRGSSRFRAMLVKDISGTTIGIVFTEISAS